MKHYISIKLEKYDEVKGILKSYELSLQENGKVWIQNQDNEGGKFDSADLFIAVEKLFNDKF